MGNTPLTKSHANVTGDHTLQRSITIDDGHEDYDLTIDMDDLSPQHLSHKGWSIKLSRELELRILDRIRHSLNEARAIAFQEENEHILSSIQSQIHEFSPLSSGQPQTEKQTVPSSFINTQAIVPGVLPTQMSNAPTRPPSPSSTFGGVASNTEATSTGTTVSNTSSAEELTPRGDEENSPMVGGASSTRRYSASSTTSPFDQVPTSRRYRNSVHQTTTNHVTKKRSHRHHQHHYINYFAEIEHQFTQQPSCIVSVLGFNRSGKTHVLNHLSGSDLRVGNSQQTPPICFKVPKNNQGRDWLLVDTVGLRGPLKISEIKKHLKDVQREANDSMDKVSNSNNTNNESPSNVHVLPANNSNNFKHGGRPLSTLTAVPAINMNALMQQNPRVQRPSTTPPTGWVDPEALLQDQWNQAVKRSVEEKKVMENVIEELLLNMSHFVLFVVNEMTWEEQELLYDLLYRRDLGINPTTGKPRKTTFIVVHNFKQCDTIEDFNKNVQRYVIDAFPGELRSKEVTLIGNNSTSTNPNGTIVGLAPFFTSGAGNRVVNHVFLAKKESDVGKKYNELTYALIRIWLASQQSERIHCMTSFITSHVQAALQIHVQNIKDVQMNFKIKEGLLEDEATHVVNHEKPVVEKSNETSPSLLSSWSNMIRGSNTESQSTVTSQTMTNVPSIGEFVLKFLPEDDCQLQWTNTVLEKKEISTSPGVVGMYEGGTSKQLVTTDSPNSLH